MDGQILQSDLLLLLLLFGSNWIISYSIRFMESFLRVANNKNDIQFVNSKNSENWFVHFFPPHRNWRRNCMLNKLKDIFNSSKLWTLYLLWMHSAHGMCAALLFSRVHYRLKLMGVACVYLPSPFWCHAIFPDQSFVHMYSVFTELHWRS